MYHATHANVRKHIKKINQHVQVGEVDKSKPFNCEIICGSHNLHYICFVSHKDPTLIQCHKMSCFCVACMDRISNERCENEIQWSLQRLKPSNS
jgi:hypothetical protein